MQINDSIQKITKLLETIAILITFRMHTKRNVKTKYQMYVLCIHLFKLNKMHALFLLVVDHQIVLLNGSFGILIWNIFARPRHS